MAQDATCMSQTGETSMKVMIGSAVVAALVVAGGAGSITENAAAQTFAIGISIHTAPPTLPVYVQPPCPRPG